MTVPQDRNTPGPRPRRAERRRRLLAQARRLFAAHGYAAVSPAQIAEAAELTEAVFSRYYPAKIDLFRDLLADLLAATLDAWRDETADVADPPARLRALGERCLAFASAEAEAVRAVTRVVAEADGETQEDARAFALAWEGFLADLIARGQQAGVFRRSLDPRVGAWQLIHAVLGCALTAPLCLPLHEQADYAAQVIDCATHCLLKTDV